MKKESLLVVENLTVEYETAGRRFAAVAGINFEIQKGETLGLVGESGCGKSSTGRAIIQLPRPSSGTVQFEGIYLAQLTGQQLRKVRQRIQMIFQDPISSLNPRRRVRDIVAEPLAIAGIKDKSEREHRVRTALEAVGVDPDISMDRRPHQFSGGQCQRICLARTLVMEPSLVVCDEPASALDVSVQAQILNLLEDMKQKYGLTMLFISHDLSVVKNISDRVAVMYLGKICEIAPSERLYEAPAHPYTSALLASIPCNQGGAHCYTDLMLLGEVPSPMNPPSGCRFRTRCSRAEAKCAERVPKFTEIGPGHLVSCNFPLMVDSN
jgi:peptide/nickel transport system ATP-binding protein